MKSLSSIFSNAIIREVKKGATVETSLNALRKVLKQYNLETLESSILKKVKRSLLEEKKFSSYRIESPFPLSEDSIALIQKVIPQEEGCASEVTINPKLLAGFKVFAKGSVYDASAANYLQKLFK